jgi:flavin-dependent thymidylate synthase
VNVSLIDYTGAGSLDPARYAAERLVFTKQTRLEMDALALLKVQAMSYEDLLVELKYMSNTIPSSWEFVDYTFLINGVTRAFTHQFVRTRNGSYAQQTMRVLDVKGWDYTTGPTIKANSEMDSIYSQAMDEIDATYRDLIAAGAAIEDARGVLPTNIKTNIVAKFNLRTVAEIARKRASSRTQGEYREVMEKMLVSVLRVHPWASMFFSRTFDVAARELEEMINRGCVLDAEDRAKAIKLLDQMRGTAS